MTDQIMKYSERNPWRGCGGNQNGRAISNTRDFATDDKHFLLYHVSEAA